MAGALGTLAVESHNALPYVAALAWTAVISVLLAIRPAPAPANSSVETELQQA